MSASRTVARNRDRRDGLVGLIQHIAKRLKLTRSSFAVLFRRFGNGTRRLLDTLQELLGLIGFLGWNFYWPLQSQPPDRWRS